MTSYPYSHIFAFYILSHTQNVLKVFYDKMKDSQQEIKSTVTVNTSDLSKTHEDKDPSKEIDKLNKKKGKSS